MWLWFVIGGLLVFAASFVVAGLLARRDGRRFLAEGVAVRGRVVGTFDDVVNEDLGVRVEYQLDGRAYVVSFRAWKEDVRVGEEVELRCLPSAPSDARRYRPDMGVGDMTGFLVGAGVAAVAAAVLLGLRLVAIL